MLSSPVWNPKHDALFYVLRPLPNLFLNGFGWEEPGSDCALCKTPPRFFRYNINIQETMRIIACGFNIVHFTELTSRNGIAKSTVNLMQLSLVTGLENQITRNLEKGTIGCQNVGVNCFVGTKYLFSSFKQTYKSNNVLH